MGKMVETDFDFDVIREEISKTSMETGVYVGCDSKQFKKHGKKYVTYVTVIVLHIDSKHGGRMFKATTFKPDYGDIFTRLFHEVELAASAANEIKDVVGDRPFEIHLDLNPKITAGSNICVKAAKGYIVGTLGFEPKIKPEAMIASTVSDKHAVSTAENNKSRRGK